MGNRGYRAIALLLAGASLWAPGAVFAQNSADDDVSPNTSVRERFKPEYSPRGMKLGGFTAFPALTQTAAVDDNIFASEPDLAVSDIFFRSLATADIFSNWSVHRLRLTASVDDRRYVDVSSEQRTDYSVAGEVRLDATRRIAIELNARIARAAEQRDSTQTVNISDRPVRFTDKSVGASIRFRQSRFEEQFWLSYQDLDFDSVVVTGVGEVDQDFRDAQVWRGAARLSYRLGPFLSAFTQLNFEDTAYDDVQPEVFEFQNSETVAALGGVAFDIARVSRAEIAVGYIDRDYDSSAFQDISGVNVDAEVEYFLSDLTTVTTRFDRTVAESNIFFGGGFYANRIEAVVDHELLPNLILGVNGAFQSDDYRTIDRTDRIFGVGASVEYLFRRQVALTARYDRAQLKSDGDFTRPDFRKNLFWVGVQFRV